MEILCSLTNLVHKKDSFYWIGEQYPASEFSLRNINSNPIKLKMIIGNKTVIIGDVDLQSAFRIVHPGAVYLHDGNAYEVKALKLEESTAELVPLIDDYITEPRVNNSINVDSIIASKQNNTYKSFFGELRVIEKVSGFKRIDWKTQQILGIEELHLPEKELLTQGVWLGLPRTSIDSLKKSTFGRAILTNTVKNGRY